MKRIMNKAAWPAKFFFNRLLEIVFVEMKMTNFGHLNLTRDEYAHIVKIFVCQSSLVI